MRLLPRSIKKRTKTYYSRKPPAPLRCRQFCQDILARWITSGGHTLLSYFPRIRMCSEVRHQGTSIAVHLQCRCGPSPIEPRQRCAFYVLCVLKHFYVCWNYSFTWRNMMVSEHGGLYICIYMYLYIYIYTCICLYIDTSADRCGHIVAGFPTCSNIF